jgi:hypothetical protein
MLLVQVCHPLFRDGDGLQCFKSCDWFFECFDKAFYVWSMPLCKLLHTVAIHMVLKFYERKVKGALNRLIFVCPLFFYEVKTGLRGYFLGFRALLTRLLTFRYCPVDGA